MRASGSSTTFGRSPCAKARAVAQFHSEPRLDGGRAVQSHHIGKPLFEKLTRPPGVGLANLSSAPFGWCRRSSFCWKTTSPCRPFSLQTSTGRLGSPPSALVAVAVALDSILTAFALAPASV